MYTRETRHAKTPFPTAFTQFHQCSVKSMGTQIRSIAQTRLRFTAVPWHNELQVVITRKNVRENCLTTSSWQRHYRPGDLFSISLFNFQLILALTGTTAIQSNNTCFNKQMTVAQQAYTPNRPAKLTAH